MEAHSLGLEVPMSEYAAFGHAWLIKGLTQMRLYLVSEWKVISGAAVATYAVLKAVPELHKHFREFKEYKDLRRWKGADFYTNDDLLSATKYYIEPDCQLIDPSGQEDFRGLATVRFPVQRSLRDFLNDSSDRKYWMILADSGMGKTALMTERQESLRDSHNCRWQSAELEVGHATFAGGKAGHFSQCAHCGFFNPNCGPARRGPHSRPTLRPCVRGDRR
jgi:hypothetical protein